MFTKFIATKAKLPKKVYKNSFFESLLDTSDDWIVARTGISQRYFISDKESLLSLLKDASLSAIKNANALPEDVGIIIVATDTPVKVIPSTASLLQGELGIKKAISFDIQAACAGFVYGVCIADSLLKSIKTNKYALIASASQYSSILNFKDRSSSILFGDGVGCSLLSLSKTAGIIDISLSCDGKHSSILNVPWGIAKGYNNIKKDSGYLAMDGRAVFKLSVSLVSDEIKLFLSKNNLKANDIDWFIPHQANQRIVKAIANRVGIELKKCIIILKEYANMSSASIPVALDYAIKSKKIKKGDLVLVEGFGAGFTWGSILFRA